MSIEILTLKEAAELIKPCKTIRTVKSYCRRNRIEIFSEQGGKRQYVIKDEFLTIRDGSLKSKEGFSLREHAELLNQAFSKYFIDKEKNVNGRGYLPVGSNEKRFSNLLKNII